MVLANNVNVSRIKSEVAAWEVQGIYFRGCSITLYSGNPPIRTIYYPSEVGVAWLILRYTVEKYVEEMGVYTERVQYADAPPNPPVTLGKTYDTVERDTEDVIVGVKRELKAPPTVSFYVNLMSVEYGLEKITEMNRSATWEVRWEVAKRLKPNPASVVV
jgi:hypothetical protein